MYKLVKLCCYYANEIIYEKNISLYAIMHSTSY